MIYNNRETLVRRPEFCLVVKRLRRSCAGFKAEGLEKHYPGLCQRQAFNHSAKSDAFFIRIFHAKQICLEDNTDKTYILLNSTEGKNISSRKHEIG